MELAQAKIPTLPPDWTAARIAKYATKLGLFILVPGLHQIACRRRILGGLLMVLYFAVEFTLSNKPFEIPIEPFQIFRLTLNLSDVFQHFSWILIAVDIRNLEERKLRLNFFLVLSCAAGIYFVPNHHAGTISIFVEQKNNACPTFCKFDIVEFDIISPDVDTISVGDYVILDGYERPIYTSRIMAGPPAKACTNDSRTTLDLPHDNYFCDLTSNSYNYDFLVRGHSRWKYENIAGRNISMISEFLVHGVRPRKIGNLREYFILTDGITDVVGKALLAVYKWTGFNLFGLSESKNLPKHS